MLHKERTYIMIKIDGIQRSLVGEIIKRFENAGLKIVAMKMFVPDEETAKKFYHKEDDWCIEKGTIMTENIKKNGGTPEKEPIEYGRDILRTLAGYLTAGPVIGMVLEGNRAVQVAMKIIGSTEPASSDVGTIRGDYTLDSYEIANDNARAVRNLIHRSDDPENAAEEIAMWLDPSDIVNYRHINQAMLYDVNLDGILE